MSDILLYRLTQMIKRRMTILSCRQAAIIYQSDYVSDTAAAAVKAENRIYPGLLQGIWLDVLLAVLLVILYVITMAASEMVGSYSNSVTSLWIDGGMTTAWTMLTAFFGMLLCMELAIRMKIRTHQQRRTFTPACPWAVFCHMEVFYCLEEIARGFS